MSERTRPSSLTATSSPSSSTSPGTLVAIAVARLGAFATGRFSRQHIEYARLPLTLSITSTQSSTDSYNLGAGGRAYLDEDEDGFRARLAQWWNTAAPTTKWSSMPITSNVCTSPKPLSHTALPDSQQSSLLSSQWRQHKRIIVQCAATLAIAALLASGTYSLMHSKTPFLDAASVSSCETGPWDELGWFQHSVIADELEAPRQAQQKHHSIRPLEFQRRTSQACADLWVSKGQLCQDLLVKPATLAADAPETSMSSPESTLLGDAEIDVTWSFVEPTPHWRKWEQAYKGLSPVMESEEAAATEGNHFRSYDEIRYSIRSVVQNLPFVRKMSLLATSLPAANPPEERLLPNETTAFSAQSGGCRVAQTPEWMDLNAVKLTPGGSGSDVSDSKFEVLSQWEQFDPQTIDQEEALAWKHKVLSTFNSHSIESQLYNLPDPAETMLYLNNDCYIGRPLLPSDMSTHLFGPVFRIYPHSWSSGAASLEEAMAIDGEGNARVMPNTIRHIDNRFGRRDRNYPDHVGYVLSTAMMDEIAEIWPVELKETAAVRFRGKGAEVWLPLLTMYYIIEKQREATLWSFLVARADIDGSGTYSLSERQAMLADLGGERDGDILRFRTPRRTWDDPSHKQALADVGTTVPLETQYYWTATNGYPYVSGEAGNSIFPNYDGENPAFCSILISEAFGRADFFDDAAVSGKDAQAMLRPEELLKRVAFEKIKIGDCLIAALLAQSGERGFEAFLPRRSEPSRLISLLPSWMYRKTDTQLEVPLIGGWSKNWQDTTFDLKTVVGNGWDRRDFAVRLIQRYTFAFGETQTAFNELNDDPGWISWFLWRWSEDKPPFMVLNDHVTTSNITIQDLIRERVEDFQNSLWPNATIYEKVGA